MVRRHASPPRREDDREGHYVFSFGENLTPRCKFLLILHVDSHGLIRINEFEQAMMLN